MKVLALVSDAFGGEGGIARFNRDLLAALASRPEIESVDVLCRNSATHREPLPPRLRQAEVAAGRSGFALRTLADAVRGGRRDVVFCGHLHLAPVAAAAAALLRAPMWLQLHGIEAWRRPGTLVARAASRATLVTAVSRYSRRRFLEWSDAPPHRVRVLPNTVEPRFSPGPRRAGLAARLGLRRHTLLTVGRLSASERYKGHDRVIRALPKLPTDVGYLVVGDGDDRARLEALAREQGVAGRVAFAGAVAHEDLPDYYRLADAFAMPSAGEGFGIVYLEAAACGLPVLGTGEGGAADALADGVIGDCAPADEAGLAAALRAVLDRGPQDSRRVERFTRGHFDEHVGALLGSLA